MGRSRLSDEAKRERGTLRKGRENREAPELVPVSIPAPPPDLSQREAEVWAQLAAQVNPARIVGPSDLVAFRVLVRGVALADVTASDPDASVAQKCRASGAALSLLSAFGLTPASRERAARAKAPSPEFDNLAEFLS